MSAVRLGHGQGDAGGGGRDVPGRGQALRHEGPASQTHQPPRGLHRTHGCQLQTVRTFVCLASLCVHLTILFYYFFHLLFSTPTNLIVNGDENHNLCFDFFQTLPNLRDFHPLLDYFSY